MIKNAFKNHSFGNGFWLEEKMVEWEGGINFKFPMTNQCQNPNDKRKYDLVERTSRFGESIILFLKKFPENTINRPIVDQLIRSATSIGANYMEADCAESKKDFIHKISICKKESKETMYWLHMLAVANSDKKQECRNLWKEAHELTLIFSSITKKQSVKGQISN